MKGTIYCILLGMIITGCAKHQTPITKKEQMMLLSKAEEIKIGDKEYKRLMSCTILCKDAEKIEALNRVGKRLIAQVNNSHVKNWEFILVEKESVNAGCLPNGKIFVNKGVFRVAKNDDQLATVLAHEMSHALARHANKRFSRTSILALAHDEIAILNRLQEKEADEIGLELMKKAGFKLDESVAFWENMKEINKHKGHSHTHTHMSYDQRIKDLEKVIARLEK